jgi:hypothetical protein
MKKLIIIFFSAILLSCITTNVQAQKNYVDMSISELTQRANEGDVYAQSYLGACYHDGINGVTKNYKKAVYWFRKSAEKGERTGQYGLGNSYYLGEGVTKNYQEAVKWFRKSAEQGFSFAQTKFGNCYYDGKGVTKNYQEAAKWYRKAAEQGDAFGQMQLGMCYYLGEGESQDDKNALYWFKKAQNNSKKSVFLSDMQQSLLTGMINTIESKYFLYVNDQTELTTSFSYGGGTETYTVKASGKTYNVKQLPSWCHATTNSGTFTITCDENNTAESRTDWFKVITDDDKEVKVYVKQDANPNVISGEIEKVWVEHNVMNFLQKGMNIHIKFSCNNLYNERCSACAFFYFQNGNPIKDYNYLYRTSDGNVYAETSFKPNYTNCSYSDLVIFMPYTELHLGYGFYYCKFDIQLQEKSTGSWHTFASKDNTEFTITNTGF